MAMGERAHQMSQGLGELCEDILLTSHSRQTLLNKFEQCQELSRLSPAERTRTVLDFIQFTLRAISTRNTSLDSLGWPKQPHTNHRWRFCLPQETSVHALLHCAPVMFSKLMQCMRHCVDTPGASLSPLAVFVYGSESPFSTLGSLGSSHQKPSSAREGFLILPGNQSRGSATYDHHPSAVSFEHQLPEHSGTYSEPDKGQSQEPDKPETQTVQEESPWLTADPGPSFIALLRSTRQNSGPDFESRDDDPEDFSLLSISTGHSLSSTLKRSKVSGGHVLGRKRSKS